MRFRMYYRLTGKSEPEATKFVYDKVKTLSDKKRLSHDPLDVEIEREHREPIHPCGRSYGPDALDLSQLKWAADNGHFWFLGPFKGLRVKMAKKPVNKNAKSQTI